MNALSVAVAVGIAAAAAATAEVQVIHGVSAGSFTTVRLSSAYSSPVIVCTPIYASASLLPAVPRIRNANAAAFELSAQQATPNPNTAMQYSFSCVVVEEGVYQEGSHGVKMEAHILNSAPTRSKDTLYSLPSNTGMQNSYNNPVVLTQVMTFSDSRYQVAYACSGSFRSPPTASSLRIGRSTGEDATPRASEAVGYIIFEAGQGTLPGGTSFSAQVSADVVVGVTNNGLAELPFDGSDMEAGRMVAVASVAGFDGNDGGFPVVMGVPSENAVAVAFDEDQFGDVERAHTTEQVAFVVFDGSSPPPPGGESVTLRGEHEGLVIETVAEVLLSQGGRRLRGAVEAELARVLAAAGGQVTLTGTYAGRTISTVVSLGE